MKTKKMRAGGILDVDFFQIMKWRFNGYYWNVREFLTETIPFVWLKIWHKPIYWSQWSRDCDMCEATYSGIAYMALQ